MPATPPEEELELGRGSSRGRRPVVVATAVLVLAAGWAVWRSGLGEEQQAPRPVASADASPDASAGGLGGLGASDGPSTGSRGPRTAPIPSPEVPYLRSGVLLRPDGTRRGVPDVSWTDLEELPDGRVVLATAGSVTVLGEGRTRSTYPSEGGLVHRPDRTAVAWRRPDGAVLVLDAAAARPRRVAGRVLRPACRGLRGEGLVTDDWRTCDADGHPLDARGGVALIGTGTVALALTADLTSAVTWPTDGTVTDTAWEPDGSLLAVVTDRRRVRLVRYTGVTPPLTLLDTISYDPARPLLVLP